MDTSPEDAETQSALPQLPFLGGYYHRGKILYHSEDLICDAQPFDVDVDDFESLGSIQFECSDSQNQSVYLGLQTDTEERLKSGQCPKDFFLSLLQVAFQHTGHFQNLSAKLASVWKFQTLTKTPRRQVIRASLDILARLPSVPIGTMDGVIATALFNDGFDVTSERAAYIINVPDPWLDHFCLPYHSITGADLRMNSANLDVVMRWHLYRIQLWQNLEVNRKYDSNTLNIVQCIAEFSTTSCFSINFGRSLHQYVEFLSRMNHEAILWDREYADFIYQEKLRIGQGISDSNHPDIVNLLNREVKTKEHMVARLVIQCFLWTVWQRATTLLFYLVLNATVIGKDRNDWVDLLAVGGFLLMENLSLEIDEAKDELPRLSYMCNWGFELLRTSRSSLTLDFRTLFRRFVDHFGRIPARCIRDDQGQRRCDGNAATNCERFVNSGHSNQTMHDSDCNAPTCYPISWDRDSYIRTESPRAVAVSHSTPEVKHMQYVQANAKTLAITHVWSHGQGGRPEDGINICMFKRYCRLANTYGCHSFWIDSACIPDEMTLRTEAIMNINTVFQKAKITLICDKDLMSCPVADRSIHQLETLVSAWLVSDWSVRAWTLLEGVRGGQNLHLLCAGDEILTARYLITNLMRKGSIALATLSLATLPFLSSPVDNLDSSKPSFELAGSFLAHRHASRDGDMPKIWSLLCGDSVFGNMEEFLEHIGTLRTGFLMSSAPRLSTTGFRWAPASPNLKSIDKKNKDIPILRGYHSYDGGGSVSGVVTARGLKAKWLIYEPDHNTCPKSLYLGYHGPLLSSLLHMGKNIALLQALSLDGGPYHASAGRGDNQTLESPLVALCYKESPDILVWQDVYLFKFGTSREVHFEVREILLI